jgi:hypothetical protein
MKAKKKPKTPLDAKQLQSPRVQHINGTTPTTLASDRLARCLDRFNTPTCHSVTLVLSKEKPFLRNIA